MDNNRKLVIFQDIETCDLVDVRMTRPHQLLLEQKPTSWVEDFYLPSGNGAILLFIEP